MPAMRFAGMKLGAPRAYVSKACEARRQRLDNNLTYDGHDPHGMSPA
ncbi:MAG: hypothetical protein R3216_04580 [Pseudomonas sp.]|nr:hypothetical protein [Pseudomonas sp.]